jgi:hypothetical protein
MKTLYIMALVLVFVLIAFNVSGYEPRSCGYWDYQSHLCGYNQMCSVNPHIEGSGIGICKELEPDAQFTPWPKY